MATRTEAAAHEVAAWQPQDDAPVWASAQGELVCDTRGNEFIDMSMGHGACLWGHGAVYERILGGYSAAELAQGLGSQHTTELRERAVDALCAWVAGSWPDAGELQAGVLHTGAEAVETALKTAIAATGRPRIVAFEHAYHGSFGLSAAASADPGARDAFDPPVAFTGVRREPYGTVPELDDDTACVIVEPIQGASGVVVPPTDFLAGLRTECDRVGALLVLDDVLAGCGRTGVPFEGAQCRPDILVLAKALGGGMICSAVVMGKELAESAWSGDDAPQLSTTYYGHPFSCAAMLEVMALHREHDLEALCAKFEPAMRHIARETGLGVRGKGAFWGLVGSEEDSGTRLAAALLERGVIATPSGARNECVSFTPCVTMSAASLERVVSAVIDARASCPR